MAANVLADTRADRTRARILDAGARCLARWGTSKTTIEDVAREAGLSRATVYRAFPGGRDELFVAVGIFEEGRFLYELAPELERAATLEDTLVTAIARASQWLTANEVLSYMVQHEPENLLPHIAFDRVGPLLYRTNAFLAPYLERFVDPSVSPGLSEWATRIVLSYWLKPSTRLDLTDGEQARHVVTRYLLPGLDDVVPPTIVLAAHPTPAT